MSSFHYSAPADAKSVTGILLSLNSGHHHSWFPSAFSVHSVRDKNLSPHLLPITSHLSLHVWHAIPPVPSFSLIRITAYPHPRLSASGRYRNCLNFSFATQYKKIGVETRFLLQSLLGSLSSRGNHSSPIFCQNGEVLFFVPA